MPEVVYRVVLDAYDRMYEILPEDVKALGPPNCVVAHNYSATDDATRNISKDERINFHQDLFTSDGRRVSQRRNTPVFSISLGPDSMDFEVKRPGKRKYMAFVVAKLKAGSVWLWSARDDANWLHRPWWPWGRKPKASRWVLVARWIDTVREHSLHEPYRVVSDRHHAWWLAML